MLLCSKGIILRFTHCRVIISIHIQQQHIKVLHFALQTSRLTFITTTFMNGLFFFSFFFAQDIKFKKNPILLPCGSACVVNWATKRLFVVVARRWSPSFTCSANILVNSAPMLALLWLQSWPSVCTQLQVYFAWTEGRQQPVEGHRKIIMTLRQQQHSWENTPFRLI